MVLHGAPEGREDLGPGHFRSFAGNREQFPPWCVLLAVSRGQGKRQRQNIGPALVAQESSSIIGVSKQASKAVLRNMAFPQTRLTLIERLASGGENLDWQRFVNDYWGPVCRFALRWGAGTEDDAEDVAAQTFAALWKNRLLVRWMASRSSKLRTMLCGVVRNLLANRNRMLRTRKRLSQEVVVRLEETDREQEQVDAFYAAWVEDLLQKAIRALVVDYYRQGQGDHVRVLYGRLCLRTGIAELAESLGIKPSDVDNYYRHARQQLAEKLQHLVRQHAERYGAEGSLEEGFAEEWANLGQYLSEYGGMEHALGRVYAVDHARDDD